MPCPLDLTVVEYTYAVLHVRGREERGSDSRVGQDTDICPDNGYCVLSSNEFQFSVGLAGLALIYCPQTLNNPVYQPRKY